MEIKLTDIVCDDRYRKDFGDVQELADSIKEQGLICPIAVETLPGGKFKLLAGERRLRAHQILGLETINARTYDEGLPELRARQIELEENIMRKDFSYIEECNLKRDIHNIRLQIHGKKTSTAQDAPGWSMRDTGRLLNVSHAEVSRDVKLAETMEQFSDIDWSAFKTKNEAQKMVKRLEKTLTRQDLAAEFEKKTSNIKSFIRQVADSYVVGDFLEMSAKLPPNFADFVEIDPPYGIDLNNQKRGGTDGSYNEVDAAIYKDFMDKVFTTCNRVMKPNAWLICWFGPEPWFETIHQLLAKHFHTKRMPGVWVKHSGQTQSPLTNLANCYEMFFYARKGNAELAWPGRSNVYVAPPVHPNHKRHPTERPAELIQDIIKTFSIENAQILVPFAGSGRTMIEAYKLKRQAVGYDLADVYRNAYIEAVEKEFQNA